MFKNKWFLTLTLMTSLALRAHAEGTFEYVADFGFWQPPSCSGPTPNCPNPIAWPPGVGAITVPVDPTAPEGKNIFRFTTSVPGGTGLITNGGMDMSAYVGGSLRFWMKTSMNMNIEIEDGTPPNANITVNNTGGQWQEFELPFSSFGGGSIDFTDIRAPFLAYGVNVVGGYSVEFDDIRWTKPITSLAVYPSVVDVNFNSHRQFTVEGLTPFGESVFLYSTFNNAFPIGTFNAFNPSAPPQLQSARFTAGAAGGALTFSNASLSTAAVVNNTFGNINREFGILSETIPGLNIGFNSYIGTAAANGNVVVSANTSDKREGNESTFISLNVGAGGFAGIFIQEGLAGSPIYRDMSHYFDGSIRFWMKAPAALQNVLEFGLRSNNVVAGRELSKVSLNNPAYGAIFDNNWHSVVIPLTDLAGPRPFADLARIKVHATFFATGNTSGPQGLLIDNLRWDSTRPGPLARIDILPTSLNTPLGTNRFLYARGFDANGFPVDTFPTWSTAGNVGTVNPTTGASVLFSAVSVPSAGTITATDGSISSTTVVVVADPTWTQSTNIYSDLGSGGYVGVAQNTGSTMNLSQVAGGVVGDTETFRRANGTLQLAGGGGDGFAVWYTNVDASNGTRYMNAYNNGYLQFWVRASRDIQISVRSANIGAGTELSKIWLSDLGVPTNNQWERVIIPMADFKALEPNLDFTQIQTFFTAAVLTTRGGVGSYSFDIDDVKWLTASTTVPDQTKVLAGLIGKQQPSGLVRSYDTLPRAVTYDQALAAMAFTFNQRYTEAQNIFNVYLAKYSAGGFAGFHEEYDVSNPSTIIDGDRIAGPNAWMLLALMHYRNVRGSGFTTQYEGMIDGLASWLLSLQDNDGAIRYGFSSLHPNEKSTEHNFDCYAAFKTYAEMRNNNTYRVAANNIAAWLQPPMYNPQQNRFNVGEFGATGLPNPDRALDAYSWAPLAMSSYTQVLNTAIPDFETIKVCTLTGNPVQGFDFSGPIGQSVDKDAVWVEGTAQMAIAFYMTGNATLGDFYANELDKAVVNVSPTTQGLPYATNAGTAYGFLMDPSNPSASSAAWYLFMKQKFNPLQPSGLFGVTIKNISNQQVSPTIGFTANVPTNWVRADQYIEIYSHPISLAPWGLQIYTNNTVPNALPRYVDPTPTTTINSDSDPAGLGWLQTGVSTTSHKLALSWRIQDSSGPVPSAIAPYTLLTGGSGQQFNWSYLKDRATPAIDANGNGVVGDPFDGTAFQDGEEYVIVKDPRGIHSSQGAAGFVPSFSPDYIYLQADFGYAGYQQTYQSNTISLDFYFQ